MKMMTPDQAFYAAVNRYPSLYMAASEEKSRFSVLNQLLNVIGNGVRDTDEFLEHLEITDETLMQKPPAKYFSGETLFVGYTEVEEFVSGMKIFKSGTDIPGAHTEEEKALHPEVKYWVKLRKTDETDRHVPYPNFHKRYSTFWCIDTAVLTPEWIREILWFYRECERFFYSDDVHFYQGFPPRDPKEMAKMVQSYEKNFARYIQDDFTDEENWERISRAYHSPGEELVEYRGDTEAFIHARWGVEHRRILFFLAETIHKLEDLLARKG